jgi:putative membrane protein
MITAEERERLAAAIRDAEAHSSGEIIVVVAGQASSYPSIPILWALLAAMLVPWLLISITTLGPSRIFLVQIVVAVTLSVVLSLPKRRYGLVPGFVKRARAHEAAAREFLARGLTRTRERTGVLIYVAVAEHYAAILADTGIADRVDPTVWQEAVGELIVALKQDRVAEGLLAAIRQVATILSKHAPPRADDVDELPNKVILL